MQRHTQKACRRDPFRALYSRSCSRWGVVTFTLKRSSEGACVAKGAVRGMRRKQKQQAAAQRYPRPQPGGSGWLCMRPSSWPCSGWLRMRPSSWPCPGPACAPPPRPPPARCATPSQPRCLGPHRRRAPAAEQAEAGTRSQVVRSQMRGPTSGPGSRWAVAQQSPALGWKWAREQGAWVAK